MTRRPPRKKVAILGGGPGGLTTAFYLTSTLALQAEYDVTVYQLGWRLGGKGSSGRNEDYGRRIEEHGLHVWFGFYDNAFKLMQLCYQELGRAPGTPLATWDEAFFPCSDIVLYEQWGDQWIPRRFTVPENDHIPGEPGERPFLNLVVTALGLLRSEWERLSWDVLDEAAPCHRSEGPPAGGPLPRWVWPFVWPFDRGMSVSKRWGMAHLLELAELHAELLLRLPPHHLDLVFVRLLDMFRHWLWEAVVEDRVDNPDVRWFFMVYDFVSGVITGIYRDRLLERGFGVVNDEELSAWLERQGVTRLTLEHAPFLRAFYDLVFGFEQGDTERPNVAAGKAIQALIRIAGCYKGAILWKMRAGMGDAVFAPLYEVLKGRGVKFRFFHEVTDLKLSRDRQHVSSIMVRPQVKLAGGRDEYDPLISVNDLPCWPSKPKWDQIEGGPELQDSGFDLESELRARRPRRLELRRGRDFDVAVLAIPVGALPDICGELAADPTNPDFGRMLENSHTVATQAFQLWMNRSVAELGWPYGADTVMSSYVEPLDTYCDMSHLIEAEDWPGDEVASIAYFCGVLPDAVGADPVEARAAVRDYAVRYLEDHAGRVWRGARGPAGGFEWKVIADPDDESGEARFDSQYWRANISGTERYVTTPAGSVAYRLRADESGYQNLFLAGDWTRNGIDGGSVEAAVTSGMQAARGICGEPKVIPGEDGLLEGD